MGAFMDHNGRVMQAMQILKSLYHGDREERLHRVESIFSVLVCGRSLLDFWMLLALYICKIT